MPAVAQWGGESTSLDYEPYIEGDTIIDPPVSLLSHSISGITPETLDALFQNYVKKVRGKIVRRRRTVRPVEQIGGSFTINVGNAPWSPVLHIARLNIKACPKTIYGIRLCTDDPQHEMAYIFTEARLNPPTFVNDFITVGGDAQLAEQQVEGTYEEDVIVWAIGLYENDTLDDAQYAIAFRTEECEGCDTGQPYTDLIVGGGGLAEDDLTVAYNTDNRFADLTTLTHLIPIEHVVTDIYTDGKIALLAFANMPSAGDVGGATGGVSYSDNINEAAPTFTLDTNITECVFGVAKFRETYIAVGGTAAGDGLIWTSTNGTAWTALSSGALATGHAFNRIAVDEERERFYIVGQNGVAIVGRPAGDTFLLSALTPDNVGTNDLYAVAVLGNNHLALGGAAGAYAESLDGGTTWVNPAVPGTSAIRRIKGTAYRTVVAAGTSLYQRTILSLNEFKTIPIQEGATISGDIFGLDVGEDWNYVAYCTDDGEVGLCFPFYPNA